jgi:hypothetical protein
VRLALIVATFCSCGYGAYRGDGTFRDHGWFWGSGRFDLDLGELDLTAPGVKRYAMANLPPERMVVGLGFKAVLTPRPTDGGVPLNSVVHLKLSSSAGTLIHETRPLTEWIRSELDGFPTFMYCKGLGNTWSEEPGTAWGCVFKPKSGEQYHLTLEVIEPDTRHRDSVARLIVEGGPPDFLP